MIRLLLISCSSVKSAHSEALPALDRYEGTTYKVIKKAKKEGYWPEDTHIFIVSAKYGLISEHTPIPFYDQKMTPARARELQGEVSNTLNTHLKESHYEKIFINMGETYMSSIAASC